MGSWLSEQQQGNQHDETAGKHFRRMSVDLKGQENRSQPASDGDVAIAKSSKKSDTTEKGNLFDAEEWCKRKILAKRRELNARLTISSQIRGSSKQVSKTVKNKYIAMEN